MSEQSNEPQFRPDILGGLPQSEHGGLHPELRARLTAASAALGDFYREDTANQESGAPVDYVSWSGRLAAELVSLLGVIERHSS